MTTVIPDRSRPDRIFQKSRRETASTPVVGSSRKMIRGLWILAHAAGEPVGQPVPEGRETGELQELLAAGPEVADEVDLGGELDVLVDRQVPVEAELLREVADAALEERGVLDDVEAQDGGPTRGGREKAAEHAEDRRLAGPVRTDEAEHLPFPDLEVEGADGLDVPEGLGEALRLDGRDIAHRGRPSVATRRTASAGSPGLRSPSRFSISTLIPKTSLTRSSLVWTFFGVNSASGEM
jgi:hypothetical protein